MNYAYDIIINLNELYYDFYEWNDDDNIEHVRKIPIFSIDNKTLNEFKNNNILFDKTFLNKIKNKTEIFTEDDIEIIEYSALFISDSASLVLELDKSGEVIRRSSLLLDEEEDTLDSYDNNHFNISYKVLNKLPIIYNTRYELGIISYIKKELNYLYKNNDIDKLNFLYSEWFGKENNDLNNLYKKLKSILNKNITSKHIEFYNLLKMCSYTD